MAKSKEEFTNFEKFKKAPKKEKHLNKANKPVRGCKAPVWE